MLPAIFDADALLGAGCEGDLAESEGDDKERRMERSERPESRDLICATTGAVTRKTRRSPGASSRWVLAELVTTSIVTGPAGAESSPEEAPPVEWQHVLEGIDASKGDQTRLRIEQGGGSRTPPDRADHSRLSPSRTRDGRASAKMFLRATIPFGILHRSRRGGRAAEGAPLLREYGLIAHRGFESLPLRQTDVAVHRECAIHTSPIHTSQCPE